MSRKYMLVAFSFLYTEKVKLLLYLDNDTSKNINLDDHSSMT